MLQQFNTCFHVDRDGTTWVTTPEGIPTQVIDTYRPSNMVATIYRVVGIPRNYKLITSLYLSLVDKEIKGSLLVGHPRICQQYQDSSLQLLNCISVINPHDNLPHTWHSVDSTSNCTFLLLEFKKDSLCNSSVELQSRLKLCYFMHITYPFWRFLKLDDCIDLAIGIISAIVDPRWYFSVNHPNRLTRLDNHFGLMGFAKFWSLYEKKEIKKFNDKESRTYLLVEAIKALPATSPILLDLTCDKNNMQDMHRACRTLLHFIVRNWLAGSMQHIEFDPNMFFQNELVKDSFLKQFGE